MEPVFEWLKAPFAEGGFFTHWMAVAAGAVLLAAVVIAVLLILKKKGIDSTIIKVSEKMSEDGKYYCDIAKELGVKIIDLNEALDPSYDIIVDCILGTGFVGDVRGGAKDAIEAINKSSAYVISVDINSGMNGDTGEASLAVESDLTVSIGYIKKGLVSEPAKKYIIKLVNVDIGIVLI